MADKKGCSVEGLHYIDPDKKARLIKKKVKELNQIFELMPDDNKKLSGDLIQNVAWMAIELQELQMIIHSTGSVEEYHNGANQSGLKLSAAVQAYNSIVKSYNSSLRLLLAELPGAESRATAKDQLAPFIVGNE